MSTGSSDTEPVNYDLHGSESNKFYEDARSYWSQIPATVDGMLGGFGHISDVDIQGSRKFLYQIYKTDNPPGKLKALDCGSGIGRITKNLLVPIFQKVDMVEQNPKFIEGSKSYLGRLMAKVNRQFIMGLQDFRPDKEQYDVVWCQWVLGHLKDTDLIRFLNDCKTGFKKHGVLIIKENVTSSGEVEDDKNDSSVTRPLWLLLKLFADAGMHCLKHVKQTNFPKGLYAVHMFALIPKERIDISQHRENATSTTSNVHSQENLDKNRDHLTQSEINATKKKEDHTNTTVPDMPISTIQEKMNVLKLKS